MYIIKMIRKFKLKTIKTLAGSQWLHFYAYRRATENSKNHNYVDLKKLVIAELSRDGSEAYELLEELQNLLITFKNTHKNAGEFNIHAVKYMLVYALMVLEYTTEDYLNDSRSLIMSKKNILKMMDAINEFDCMVTGKLKVKTKETMAKAMQNSLRSIINGKS